MHNDPKRSSRHQKGAVLFVGMMVLILLTLLAVTASQGSFMQERMASNYLAKTRAIQAAETLVSQARELTNGYVYGRNTLPAVGAVLDDSPKPFDAFLSALGSNPPAEANRVIIENMGKAASQESLAVGADGRAQATFYRISTLGVSGEGDRASVAVLQEVFVP
jgi:type IV pilus assembly protein PilX